MTKIVVTDATFPHLDHERAVAQKFGATFYEAHCRSAEEVVQAATDANVLLVQFAQVTRAALTRLAPRAAVVRYGLGLDNIDLKAASELGVRVAYVPDYATGEVADHTAALIVATLRKIILLDRSVREGKWDPVGVSSPMMALSDAVVGFIGFGRIGREVRQRLKGFGFQSLVYDPHVAAPELQSAGVRSSELEFLLRNADVITLHCPLNPSTRHVIDRQRLAWVKPTAVIVNTARGALIDANAIHEALAAGRLGWAALDVFEEEPLRADAPLRALPNVTLTPHVSWYSSRSLDRVQLLAADEVDRHLSGQPARCPALLAG